MLLRRESNYQQLPGRAVPSGNHPGHFRPDARPADRSWHPLCARVGYARQALYVTDEHLEAVLKRGQSRR